MYTIDTTVEQGTQTSRQMTDVKSLLDQLVAWAQTQPEIVALYLYGSQAEGRVNRLSDVDVAVLLSGMDEMERVVRFRNLIVHNYARIDDARVYGILKRELGDFDAFAQAIVDCLQPQTRTGPSESERR